MARKSTGKRLRFEIFKRDNFTCQYCGDQPPSVVLVIDHIQPVSKGGDNDSMNLITACEPCNQGKSDKTIDQRLPRPDADLEWLYIQQEIAELRRYQKAKQERDILLDEVIYLLNETWKTYSQIDQDNPDVIRIMLAKFSPNLVEEALQETGLKVAGGYLDRYEWESYAYGVLWNMINER